MNRPIILRPASQPRSPDVTVDRRESRAEWDESAVRRLRLGRRGRPRKMISRSERFQVSIVPISNVPTSNVWSHRTDDKLGVMRHHLPNSTSPQLLVCLRIRLNLKIAYAGVQIMTGNRLQH